MNAEPPEYLAERIRDVLAQDPRVGELDIHVSIAAQRVLVTGNVATRERQEAVGTVLGELGLEMEIHNATSVMEFAEPVVSEELT